MNKLLVLITIVALVSPVILSQAASATTFRFVGDLYGSDNIKKECAAFKVNPKSVNILVGDYYGKLSSVMNCFKTIGKKVIVDVGNHDSCSDVKKYNPCTYSYVKYGVAFQSIDTNQKSINPSTSQGKIVEANFKKWQNDSEIFGIVLHLHKSPIIFNDAHHPDKEVEKEIKGLRNFVTYLKDQYPKFRMMIAGHEHSWVVCKPDNPKILVIIDGTGGRDPYPMGDSTDDGCETDKGLSGSKYLGYTEVTMVPGSIAYKHVNIK